MKYEIADILDEANEINSSIMWTDTMLSVDGKLIETKKQTERCFEEIKQVLKNLDVKLYSSKRSDECCFILEQNDGSLEFYTESDFNE